VYDILKSHLYLQRNAKRIPFIPHTFSVKVRESKVKANQDLSRLLEYNFADLLMRNMIAMRRNTAVPRLAEDAAPKRNGGKCSLRSSTHTVQTASLTLNSSQDLSVKEVDDKDTDDRQKLARMIAQEMISTLRQANSERDLSHILANLKCTSTIDHSDNVKHCAHETTFARTGDGLSYNTTPDNATGTASEPCTSTATVRTSESTSRHSKQRAHRRSSLGTNSKLSQISLVVQRPVTLDIWHPDFWAEKSNDSAAPLESSQQFDVNLDEFLESHKEVIPDETKEDDASIMSEITGLSEAFPDYKAECKAKRAAAKNVNKTVSAVKDIYRSKPGKIARSVAFGNVEVRSFKRTIADHPECTRGPAIGIDWEYCEEEPVTVDDWEYQQRRIRRPNELLMSRECREEVLSYWGFQERDFATTIREINRIKANRRQTVTNLGLQNVEEALEGARKKVLRIILLKRSTMATGY
jgi:hypothetical protein